MNRAIVLPAPSGQFTYTQKDLDTVARSACKGKGRCTDWRMVCHDNGNYSLQATWKNRKGNQGWVAAAI